MKKLDIPKPVAADYVHSAIKAIIGLPPGGGAIVEVWSAVITSPLESRKTKWMEEVVEELKRLEDENKGTVEKLVKDEEFISLLLQATQNAIKTHQEEKRRQLKNALMNSIDSPHKYDLRRAFINLIDELSPTHIKVLKLIYDHRENRQIVFENKYSAIFNRLIAYYSYDPLNPEPDFETFRLILTQLKDRQLIQISDDIADDEQQVRMQTTRVLETESGDDEHLPFFHVTNYGGNFLKFIESD